MIAGASVSFMPRTKCAVPPVYLSTRCCLQFCVTLYCVTVSFSGANELCHHLKWVELDGRTVRSSAPCCRLPSFTNSGPCHAAVSRFYNAHRDRALPVALMTIEECEEHRD